MATKLFDILNTPLAPSKFASASDRTEQALQERQMAADAMECIQAQILCLEAELEYLDTQMEDPRKLETLRRITYDLRAATLAEDHSPKTAG